MAPLQFIPIEEFSPFVVVGRDLHHRSWRVRLLPSKAFFSASLNCRSCRLFLVDYGQKLSRQQADAMAASLASRKAAS